MLSRACSERGFGAGKGQAHSSFREEIGNAGFIMTVILLIFGLILFVVAMIATINSIHHRTSARIFYIVVLS